MFQIGTSFWFSSSCAEVVGAEIGLDARVTFEVRFTEGLEQQVRVLSPEEVLNVARNAQAINIDGAMLNTGEVFGLSPISREEKGGFGISS